MECSPNFTAASSSQWVRNLEKNSASLWSGSSVINVSYFWILINTSAHGSFSFTLYLISQPTVAVGASPMVILSWLLQLSLLKWMADHQYQHQSSSLLIPAVRCLGVSISKLKMIQFKLEPRPFGMSFMNSWNFCSICEHSNRIIWKIPFWDPTTWFVSSSHPAYLSFI